MLADLYSIIAWSNLCYHRDMKKHNRPYAMVFVSLFLGMTALLVSFGAASAFETPGTTSFREIIAACVAAALYLAFCQFWVAPRSRSGFWAKLPTLVASVAPLLVHQLVLRAFGIPWLVAGCLGSVIGAMIAQRVTATSQGGIATDDSSNRDKRCRRNLLAGFILLIAVALLIPIGVILLVLADPNPRINARAVGGFLGITVLFDLKAALVLGNALWRPRERDPSSKGTLGTTAFLALWLGLAYGAFGIGILVGGLGPGLRIVSVVLVLCAVCGLITTALMTVTSVIVDRARLEVDTRTDAGQHSTGTFLTGG
ncbi:MAG TPA: hypothetical protein VF480_00210 [Verrucomicrobiae bacterium]